MALATPETVPTGKLQFTFPAGDRRDPKYVSYVPSGYITMKPHSYVSAAKNSIHNRAGSYNHSKCGMVYKEAYVLERVEGRWFILYAIPENTLWSDLPWMIDKVTTSYNRNPKYISYRETPDEPSYIVSETTDRVAAPMSMDEYAAWRISVDRELRKAENDSAV